MSLSNYIANNNNPECSPVGVEDGSLDTSLGVVLREWKRSVLVDHSDDSDNNTRYSVATLAHASYRYRV